MGNSISYRDLEEMLMERGIEVDHSTIYRWAQYYAPNKKLLKEIEKQIDNIELSISNILADNPLIKQAYDNLDYSRNW